LGRFMFRVQIFPTDPVFHTICCSRQGRLPFPPKTIIDHPLFVFSHDLFVFVRFPSFFSTLRFPTIPLCLNLVCFRTQALFFFSFFICSPVFPLRMLPTNLCFFDVLPLGRPPPSFPPGYVVLGVRLLLAVWLDVRGFCVFSFLSNVSQFARLFIFTLPHSGSVLIRLASPSSGLIYTTPIRIFWFFRFVDFNPGFPVYCFLVEISVVYTYLCTFLHVVNPTPCLVSLDFGSVVF